ncbi:hypothetical protein AK830_g11111 [Neonectria ditissima]|uniref:Uncharacterized protein n=1 Tax=Neonectria ditissima TaxID=78410 RepID=A0A0P7B5P9_9HYPO|nr:hypothetical protein AK830_g11111 [Neonectria ditissima]
MHDADPIHALGLDCPEGGDFWICTTKPTLFIGCCTTNPCETDYGVCPDEDLKPATFDPHAFDLIPEQACISDNFQVHWYTCSGTKPPFLGCCAVDPCHKGGGCPAQSLRAARLSRVVEDADRFLDGDATSTATETLATMTFESFTATATADSRRPSPNADTGSGLSPGAIAGLVLGVMAFCAVAAVYLRRTFRKLYRGGRDRQEARSGETEENDVEIQATTQGTADVSAAGVGGSSRLGALTQPANTQQQPRRPHLNDSTPPVTRQQSRRPHLNDSAPPVTQQQPRRPLSSVSAPPVTTQQQSRGPNTRVSAPPPTATRPPAQQESQQQRNSYLDASTPPAATSQSLPRQEGIWQPPQGPQPTASTRLTHSHEREESREETSEMVATLEIRTNTGNPQPLLKPKTSWNSFQHTPPVSPEPESGEASGSKRNGLRVLELSHGPLSPIDEELMAPFESSERGREEGTAAFVAWKQEVARWATD